MTTLVLIAQVAADAIAPVAQYGILGGVVAWLCLRVEKRLDRLEHAFKGVSMAILMDLASRKVLAPAAQRLVDDLLRKMGAEPLDP